MTRFPDHVARFVFSNSYIWFEFYNAPLEKDISLICDVSSLLQFWYSTDLGAKSKPFILYINFYSDNSIMAHCWTTWWMQLFEYAGKYSSTWVSLLEAWENTGEMWIIMFRFLKSVHFLLCFWQLSEAPLDKRPTYDAIQGANVTPTEFYNIGDFEVQDNLARIW